MFRLDYDLRELTHYDPFLVDKDEICDSFSSQTPCNWKQLGNIGPFVHYLCLGLFYLFGYW